MILNRRGEYAILGLLYLARQDRTATSGGFWEVNDVAQAIEAPDKFLRILFHQLTKAGILRSQRGPGGGFGLKKPATDVTLREVIEAIQGPIASFVCVTGDGDSDICRRSGRCELYGVLREVRLKVVSELEQHTLSDLIGVELAVTGSESGRARRSRPGAKPAPLR